MREIIWWVADAATQFSVFLLLPFISVMCVIYASLNYVEASYLAGSILMAIGGTLFIVSIRLVFAYWEGKLERVVDDIADRVSDVLGIE